MSEDGRGYKKLSEREPKGVLKKKGVIKRGGIGEKFLERRKLMKVR